MINEKEYQYKVTAAGRVNLIGEHIDYCGGKVFPAALSMRNTVYIRPNGTDADNDLTGHAREYNDTKTEVIKWFLEGNEPKNVCGYDITPVGLNAEKLADIYYNNAMRLMGKSH